MPNKHVLRRPAVVGVVTAAVLLLPMAPSAQAEVKKIVIDTTISPDFDGATFGSAGPYETIRSLSVSPS